MILLFLLNFAGSIGPTAGYYFPSLDSLNTWLQWRGNGEAKNKIGTSFTVGVEGKVHIGKSFTLELGADYFKAKSQDKERSLLLVPVDAYLSYRYMILPRLIYFYLGAGYELCLVDYEGDILGEKSGWGSGIPVKASIEFIPTANLGVEFSWGYRFVTADIDLKDPETGAGIPINLWGGFLKITLKREI